MGGGSFTTCGSRHSAAQICHKSSRQFQIFARLTPPNWCVGAVSDCQGATVTLIRNAEVPEVMARHGPDSSRRNSNGDSRR
eukprot:5393182-Pyramimonas_sp.AAC.1